MVFAGFFTELKSQFVELARLVRTREFWIYLAVVALLCLLAFAGVRMAMGFDPLTRGWIAGRTQLLLAALTSELRKFVALKKPWA